MRLRPSCTKFSTIGLSCLSTLLLTACPEDDDAASTSDTGGDTAMGAATLTAGASTGLGTGLGTGPASSTGGLTGGSAGSDGTGSETTGVGTTTGVDPSSTGVSGTDTGSSTDTGDEATSTDATEESGDAESTDTGEGGESTEAGETEADTETEGGDDIGDSEDDSTSTDTGDEGTDDTTTTGDEGDDSGSTDDTSEGGDEIGDSEDESSDESGADCDPGLTECEGECVDVLTDPRFCGADRLDCSPAGERCDDDESCQRGSCVHENRWNEGDFNGDGAFLDAGGHGANSIQDIRIVTDDQGRSVIGWVEQSGRNYVVMIARRKPGPVDENPWTDPEPIFKSSDPLSNFGLLLSSGGDERSADDVIHATWVQATDAVADRSLPHFRTWDTVGHFSSTTWGRPQSIDNIGSKGTTAGSSTEPRTARGRNGDVLAVFSFDNGTTGFNHDHNHEGWIDILARRGGDEVPIQLPNPTDENAGTSRRCVNPRISAAKDGTITVIRDCIHLVGNVEQWRPWTVELGPNTGDTWQAHEAVDKRTARSVNLRNGAFDVDNDGDGIALYHDLDDTSLWMAHYDASGDPGKRWSKARKLGGLDKSLQYRLAVTEDGLAHIIWISDERELVAGTVPTSSRGVDYRPPETISYTGLEVRAADLSLAGDGRVMALFYQTYPNGAGASRDDLMIGIVSRTLDPNFGWRGFGSALSPKHVDQVNLRQPIHLQFDASGRASAAWLRKPEANEPFGIVSSNFRSADD